MGMEVFEWYLDVTIYRLKISKLVAWPAMEKWRNAANILINFTYFLWWLILFTFFIAKNYEQFLRNSCESDL